MNKDDNEQHIESNPTDTMSEGFPEFPTLHWDWQDNNVLSRIEDEQLIIRSPDTPPTKVYNDNRYQHLISNCIQLKNGNLKWSRLKQCIEQFKFTPKPQIVTRITITNTR